MTVVGIGGILSGEHLISGRTLKGALMEFFLWIILMWFIYSIIFNDENVE